MNIPTIEQFLKGDDVLMIADVRYGDGYYVGLIPASYSVLMGSIESNLRGGDTDYINTESQFVNGVYPMVVGDTIADGLVKLEALISHAFKVLEHDYCVYISDVLELYNKQNTDLPEHIEQYPNMRDRTKQLKTLLDGQ